MDIVQKLGDTISAVMTQLEKITQVITDGRFGEMSGELYELSRLVGEFENEIATGWARQTPEMPLTQISLAEADKYIQIIDNLVIEYMNLLRPELEPIVYPTGDILLSLTSLVADPIVLLLAPLLGLLRPLLVSTHNLLQQAQPV